MKTVYSNSEVKELNSQWWKYLPETIENQTIIDEWNEKYSIYLAYVTAFDCFDFENLQPILIARYGSDIAYPLINKIKKITSESIYYHSDNLRIALIDDLNELEEYNRLYSKGCCGFEDFEIKIDEFIFKVGFNYGH